MRRPAELDVLICPFLTAQLPGIGGLIKAHDEDFQVTELPAHRPAGRGGHVHFIIEKKGMTTMAAVRVIAKALGRRPGAMGYAGLKDAHGVTRQALSVEGVQLERVRALEIGRIRVISVARHPHRLEMGQLAGNRFEIRLRGVGKDALPRARAIMEVLRIRGIPNYFGPQRFGTRGDNAQVGRAVLQGDYAAALALVLGRPAAVDNPAVRRARRFFDAGRYGEAAAAWPRSFRDLARVAQVMARTRGNARQAWQAIEPRLRSLFVFAFQSELFNRVLGMRIASFDHAETGDIAWEHAGGANFLVEDGPAAEPRCAAFEISPTGPLFGPDMPMPQGIARGIEAEVLSGIGASFDQLATWQGVGLEGLRRPLRAPMTDPGADHGVDARGHFIRLVFTLPPGAYATCVTREVCKP